MFDKLERIEKRFCELSESLSDNDIISNQEEYKKIMKEY